MFNLSSDIYMVIRHFSICSGLLILLNMPAFAQPNDSFVPLFDGNSLDGWIVENSEANNFYVEDGVLRVEEPAGWLRTSQQYTDFTLKVEFRFLTDEADSGIFVRVAGDEPFARGWPGGSYQVQTRDISKNKTTSPKLLGDIYRHRMPDGETEYDTEAAENAARPTGEWQTFVIDVRGDSLTVTLNDVPITRARGLQNPGGYIGLQGETDVVEYRLIEISPDS